MYLNPNKEDTNIDDEFKNSKKKKDDKGSFKIPLIIGGIILAIIILIIIIVLITNNSNKYFLVLNGQSEITIYQGTTYNEPGYNAYDKKKNDLNSEVQVVSNIDSNTLGEYTIKYTLRGQTQTRKVKVVEKPDIITVIHLNGDKNITLSVGSVYNEPGYNAIDAIDGDLTEKVAISGSVDTSKAGTYRIVYSVVNSSGVTTSETRTIIVK